MAVVTFDATEFTGMYPRFSGVLTDSQLKQAFNVACLLLDNTNASVVPYDPDNGVTDRKTLLYLLTCHIATVAVWGEDGQSGPTSAASEGSVSVSFAVPDATNASWFRLTPCGGMYWQATRKYVVGGRYRAMRYVHPFG